MNPRRLPPKNGEGLDGVEIPSDPEPRTTDFFAMGDARGNENEILLSLHTLWLREHNLVASELAEQIPLADDELLFQLARRVGQGGGGGGSR